MDRTYLSIVSALLVPVAVACGSDKLVVHEWGTFTSLQDETGRAIGGINSDDEPLPPFVHNLRDGLIPRSPAEDLVAALTKGVPFVMPTATMRLETPVLYFYPPDEAPLPLELDVRVEFRGGWLTQFYPDAIVQAPGINAREPARLSDDTLGRLEWRRLRVGGDGQAEPPGTDSIVWNAPRGVAASPVTARNIKQPELIETERYLFYRGIANLDAPLKVVREADKLVIRPTPQLARVVPGAEITTLWLTEIREDGLLAFRQIGPLSTAAAEAKTGLATASEFKPNDFTAGSLRRLREVIHQSLVKDGLFADEAYALLNTWEASYFRTPGLRLFYLVPRPWTDYYLPLTISAPATISRVMVARTEIVTPAQRALLRQVAADRANGDSNAARLDPDALRKLGRFRDALLNDLASRPETLASSAASKDDRDRNLPPYPDGSIRDDRQTSPGR